MTISLTPEYLASLRKLADHMREHNLALQDVRGEVTLALLDAIHEARSAYLKAHEHDLQIACNEREALRARVKELEEGQNTPPDPDKMTPEERARHREACLKWLEDLGQHDTYPEPAGAVAEMRRME